MDRFSASADCGDPPEGLGTCGASVGRLGRWTEARLQLVPPLPPPMGSIMLPDWVIPVTG